MAEEIVSNTGEKEFTETVEDLSDEELSGKIITARATKIFLEETLSKFLSPVVALPDRYYYVREFVIGACGIPSLRDNMIRNLMKCGFTREEVEIIINNLIKQKFNDAYFWAIRFHDELRELNTKYAKENKSSAVEEALRNLIKTCNKNLPMINSLILVFFFALIHGTDLEVVTIPKEKLYGEDIYYYTHKQQQSKLLQ